MSLSVRFAIAFALLASQPALAQSPIMGVARAGDGDSLTVNGVRVRLFGIDAPELDQSCQRGGQAWACGSAATQELSRLVSGKQVRCVPVGTDQHGRILGRCTAGVVDINRTMVASGYAVAFRRYSNDYVTAEESARVNRRGIWSGTFEMPSTYRHEGAQPLARSARTTNRSARASSSRPTAEAASSCKIKGNRNRRGQWIYHVPGMPYYNNTRAEETFCSEAEARAAGYRRAIVK